MIVETEKTMIVAVESRAQNTIEITQPNETHKTIQVIEVGPQGPKGDTGEKGDGVDVEIYSDGVFVGLASKVNFSQAITASLSSGKIEVTAYTQKTDEFVLTAAQVLACEITLPKVPLFPEDVRLIPEGGVEQFNGIDFQVIGNVLSWKTKGLEGFLEAGERILVTY